MATSQQIKDAADAVAAAKADELSAETAMNAKFAEALALIPDDVAAYEAAQLAYNDALNGALANVGYGASVDVYTSALTVKQAAVDALIPLAAQYDGV